MSHKSSGIMDRIHRVDKNLVELMENLLQYLNSIHLLSEDLQDYLRKILKHKSVRKKDFLLKAGHISGIVCFIETGLLRCYFLKDDQEMTSWFMKEGDVIFSIESFYEQAPSKENIQALEDCSLYYITYSELEYVYRNFMEFNFIGRVLTIRYQTLWVKLFNSFRMSSAEERYEWVLKNHPDLELRGVPAKHIASYLGITEVTLSNVKGKRRSNS